MTYKTQTCHLVTPIPFSHVLQCLLDDSFLEINIVYSSTSFSTQWSDIVTVWKNSKKKKKEEEEEEKNVTKKKSDHSSK